MSAGRPLEPAGNGRPRWMAAAGAPTGVPGTESGVQVDSSVAHQVAALSSADLLAPGIYSEQREREHDHGEA